MGYSKSDTKNQALTQNIDLIADVKKSIQLALDESGWSRIGKNKKPKVMISENKMLGDSGMPWNIDLAVIDSKEKPFLIIYCIDFTASTKIENALTKTAAACQDLYSMDARIILAVNREQRHEKQKNKLLPMGYGLLFESVHVDVIEWDSKHAFEVVLDLLHRLRRQHHGSMHSIKNVRETIKNLTEKYPDLFTDNRQMPKKTNCLELLQQIKQSDLHQNFGEIIKDVLSQDGICQSLVGTKLNSISDSKLEKLLREYLGQQK